MIIQYNIVVTIVNLIDNSTSRFSKIFDAEITATDALLYNNYHVLSNGVYILDMFEDEVDAYCTALGIQRSSVEIDEFEIVSLTDRTDVFFESDENNSLSLRPIIKCYVYPRNEALRVPNLVGVAYDSTTIIWSWPDDEQYAHYLVEESIDPNSEADRSRIIAQLPIGATSYTETGLEPNTPYTRRLINYTDEQTSTPSPSVTVMTETVEASESLEQYTIPKNYDFTTNDSEREIIEENLPAFHSGVGDVNDLKVYKQMDADFYQKFKAYFELSGRRIQREKRYDQVGFNYKVCLEAEETVEEQEGEVTFDVDVYPREWIAIEDYVWTTHPVNVKTRLTATVFLRKEEQQEEVEEVQLWEPDVEDVPITRKFSKPTALVISVDLSGSMSQSVGGRTRISKTRDAVKSLITHVHQEAQNEAAADGATMPSDLIQYVIIGWGNFAGSVYNGTDKDAAIAAVDSLTPGRWGTYTCFTAGLNHAVQGNYVMPDRQVIGQIFFTDGFCNLSTPESGHSTFGITRSISSHGPKCDAILSSITSNIPKTFVVFGNGVNHYDTDYRAYYSNHIPGIISFGREIIAKCQSQFGAGNCYVPADDASFDNMSEAELADKLISGLKIFGEEIIGYKKVFKGWKKKEKSSVQKYNIDNIKAVTVTTDPINFTFDEDVTPVAYVRKEKRAIIPASNFLQPTKITNESIYDLIMAKVQQTPEWRAGYNKTIGTVETGNEPDKFLVKGLFIQDTYNFADEDEITEANWGLATWEDGLDGTVNTFTDVDKAGTSTYGDDCYIVSKDNYLMIQGYTDAIIYDCTRFVRTELNAYDHPSEILVSIAPGVYDHLLINRKKENLTYAQIGAGGTINHIIDVIEIGKDMYFTGLNANGILYEDFIAHNDTIYHSPILNYRFNLEDPDAKTPLREILPECDQMSDYLHIVILHVYYAKNVYITNTSNYVSQYGSDPIATTSSEYIPLVENLYKWTLKEWKEKRENGWYIDEYIWFMAKPMKKRQDYYDELPGIGMDTFYGLVNGRYRSDNQDGKHDLRVDTPQFNIPTTVHKETIRIYITITEFYPESALVSYKWENPWNNKNGITQVNGDYVTFSSDSLTYKDIEYIDVVSTINMENQEIFDNKTTEQFFELSKPETFYEYKNYYLKVTTDNSDVLAMHYPTEIVFDENGLALVGVGFKGVINATSQWAPRIHNGYYYLNQHEYFAYSEFDVQAKFDTYEETNFKTANGYISFDVQLRHRAASAKRYSITKDTRSELLQDEEHFTWVDGKGLTIKPYIDGEYYQEYLTYTYMSPIILFDNVLTEAGPLKVDYFFDDGSEYLPMEVRSYIIGEGVWSDWHSFTNNTVPNVPLSCAYQVRFNLQASIQNTEKNLEDYMCCYLDWKEDMNTANTTNIVTITDHMTTGPYDSQGVYVSKVFDYGCQTELSLDIFESKYKERAKLYIAYTANNPDVLLLENITWYDISNIKDTAFKARYFRYKIVIPSGEKVYWLHKKIKTLETHELLPYVTGISMTGTFTPSDVVTNFINTEAFEVLKDGNLHTIFERVSDVIGADVLEKGYTMNEIEYIVIQCTTGDIEIQYDSNLDRQYPAAYLDTPIKAMSDIDVSIIVKNTPYIFVEKDRNEEHDIIKITGTPQQFCPITVEDTEGNTYIQLHNATSFLQEEIFLLTEETKYLELKTNRYASLEDFKVYLDGDEFDSSNYRVVNHLVIFNEHIGIGHTITIQYYITRSFIAVVDRPNNTTTIYLYSGRGIDTPKKCKVYFETGTRNNKFVAEELSLNPIYRTDYKGFIYLTDEHNEPYEIKIYCNPLRLKAGGYDKVDVSIEVLDIKGNPVISKDVAVDCECGILNCESYETDINGVIHLVYESAYYKCTDTLTARVLTDDNTVIKQSITIINE